jgi:cell division protein ZapA
MGDESGASSSPAPVQITVFDQTYRIVAADGGERAARVARLVDERMREVAARMTTLDVAKIAVVAALNIADDLLRLREASEPREADSGASAPPVEGVDAPPVNGADAEGSNTPARISWFESVFDADLGSPERRAGRMSHEFAERLQSARQPGEAAATGERNRAVGDDRASREARRKEREMTDQHKPRHDEKSERILRWLHEHRAEFEGSGVSEGSLAAAVGLSEEEVTEAVDHLENREAVARLPQHDTSQPGFLLEPARGWADVCEELGRGAAAGETNA